MAAMLRCPSWIGGMRKATVQTETKWFILLPPRLDCPPSEASPEPPVVVMVTHLNALSKVNRLMVLVGWEAHVVLPLLQDPRLSSRYGLALHSRRKHTLQVVVVVVAPVVVVAAAAAACSRTPSGPKPLHLAFRRRPQASLHPPLLTIFSRMAKA